VATVGDMSALVTSGKIGLGDALAQVPTLLRSNDPQVVRRAARVVAGVSREMIPEKLEPNYKRFVNRLFRARARKLGWDAKKDDSDDIKLLRSTLIDMVAGRVEDPVLIEQAKQKARTWLDKRTGIDNDMLDDVLGLAARHDAKLYQRYADALEKTEDITERRALLRGMAGTRDSKQIIANLNLAVSGKYGLRESGALIWVPLSRPDTRQLMYDQIKQNYDQILEKLPRMAHRFILSIPSVFCDQAHYDDAKAFFGPKAEKLPGGTIVFERTLERIELCMVYRTAQQASVEAFLKKY
jgi:alanyl aminopeptidase